MCDNVGIEVIRILSPIHKNLNKLLFLDVEILLVNFSNRRQGIKLLIQKLNHAKDLTSER